MTGAMYAAIAGLRTHMQNLNVIGNNVANVNTNGYKSSRAVFKTSLYTTLNGGSNGTAVLGGTNPSQIGYGSSVSTVDVDMSTGNYAVTGKTTDLMLDGDGFFMVGGKDIAENFNGTIRDASTLTALNLTRVGNFEFRADGYLGKEDGNVVYGFLCTGVWGDANHPLKVKAVGTPPAGVTPDADGNIPNPEMPKNAKEGDPVFSDQLVPIRYPRVEKVDMYYDAKTGVKVDPQPTTPPTDAEIEQKGWEKRSETVIRYPEDRNITTDPTTGAVTLGAHKPLTDAGVVNGEHTLSQAQFEGITFDQNTGVITGTSRDTKEVVTIGCIAVGMVTNPNGVTNLGDNYYKAGEGSGELTVSILGGNAEAMNIQYINKSLNEGATDDVDALRARTSETKCLSNGLEMSKTDLAQEISSMILTQRGYQANTRIVTVTDSMLEELVNMKR